MLADIVTSHADRAVLRAGDVFIKVDTDHDRVEREVAALGAVSIPSPQVLWQRAGMTYLLALSEVEGTELGVLGAASDRPNAAWAAAGRVAFDLHNHVVPDALSRPSRYLLESLDELEEWLLRRDLADHGLVAEHAGRARAARDSASQEALVHGDLQAAHIFVTDDNEISGVIDWGDAGLGDPHHDLAVLTVEHSEHLDAVVVGYGARVDLDRVQGYWSWRRLGSVRWRIEHGFDASGDIAALSDGV